MTCVFAAFFRGMFTGAFLMILFLSLTDDL